MVRRSYVGRQHHTKTPVVVPVVRVVPVAVGRAGVLWIVDPGATAQHASVMIGAPDWKTSPAIMAKYLYGRQVIVTS